MRPTAAALPMLALTFVLGCGSPCQELADRICACQATSALRSACSSSVGNQIGSASQQPGPADQAFCQEKLATCPDTTKAPWQCPVLQSADGKVACGLAYPQDSTTSG